MNRIILLKKMRNEISQCTMCSMYQSCNQPVPFAGNLASQILLIGRDPGAEEDKYGFPFIGESGALLEKAWNKVNFNIWDECIISNVMKCRPENNKEPTPSIYQFCYEQWLKKEIEIIQPKIVLLLGKRAVSTLFPGLILRNGETTTLNNIEYYHIYHPSFWVRNGKMKYAEKYIVPIFSQWMLDWEKRGLLIRHYSENLITPKGGYS